MDDGLPCASFEPLNTPSPLKKKSRTYFSEKKSFFSNSQNDA